MDINTHIRQLARSDYYQNLYSSSKDINSLQIFDNDKNFSGLQILFLFWLQVYSILYQELHEQKWRWLDEEVIKHDKRCDAFLYWRKRQNEFEMQKHKNDSKLNNIKLKDKSNVTPYSVKFE